MNHKTDFQPLFAVLFCAGRRWRRPEGNPKGGEARGRQPEVKNSCTRRIGVLSSVCCLLTALLLPATKASAQTNTNCLLVMTCPSNIVVTSCFNVQEFYTPTASNICCGVNSTVNCTPPSGSIFAVGTTTTVTCTATDCDPEHELLHFHRDRAAGHQLRDQLFADSVPEQHRGDVLHQHPGVLRADGDGHLLQQLDRGLLAALGLFLCAEHNQPG
jgi:hypothetical protein